MLIFQDIVFISQYNFLCKKRSQRIHLPGCKANNAYCQITECVKKVKQCITAIFLGSILYHYQYQVLKELKSHYKNVSAKNKSKYLKIIIKVLQYTKTTNQNYEKYFLA